MIEAYGATIYPSPSDRTEAGRKILEMDADTPGSLGIAISEAIEVAATHDDVKYSIGSALNHLLLHQTVVGEEVLKQLALVGETADVVIGCAGGGSNFSGFSFPIVQGEACREHRSGDPCRGACGCPLADERQLPLRLWRHHRVNAPYQDVHPGSRLHSRPHSCWWAALPRHGAPALPPGQGGGCRSGVASPK